MTGFKKNLLSLLIAGVYLFGNSCKNGDGGAESKKPSRPPVQEKIADDLKNLIEFADQRNGQMNDTLYLRFIHLIDSTYDRNQFEPVWSRNGEWLPIGDSLYHFVERAKNYGLFPDDYHYKAISFAHRVFQADSLAKKNLLLWARADLLLTDAFFGLVKDLKQGRLAHDSVTLRTDTVLKNSIYTSTLAKALQSGNLDSTLHELEPRYPGYDSLKAGIKDFLARANFSPYTYLVYPYKDSVSFFKSMETRLHELGEIPATMQNLDSNAFRKVFRKYQKEMGLTITGRLSDQMVDQMNLTDWEKFKKIAVNLDRYKQLPDTLPQTRAWVNLPSYYLQVYDSDTLVFQSRIIVGGPQTRTPLLTSEISNFITYPQWTVPYSIIFKEMLPKIQKNVDFLAKENLMVVDQYDSVLDPTKIKWAKLDRNHFPYLIKQKQGDENSLGVIKFNFRNKYSVYMHDTNVRWMFNKSFRAISHGCVRVKEWPKLANFLVRKDSIRYQPDTLRAWITRQEKHVVSGFPKLPLYIRYFTCEGKNGRIRFYEDIYEEDRYLREKYFAGKSVE